MRKLWLVNQLWFIVPVNSWKNRTSSESLYKSNRSQVSMVYKLINHLGCWYNTRRTHKSLAYGLWFTNSSHVLPTSHVVYQRIKLINNREQASKKVVHQLRGLHGSLKGNKRNLYHLNLWLPVLSIITSATISDSAECYAGMSVRFESSATCM